MDPEREKFKEFREEYEQSSVANKAAAEKNEVVVMGRAALPTEKPKKRPASGAAASGAPSMSVAASRSSPRAKAPKHMHDA